MALFAAIFLAVALAAPQVPGTKVAPGIIERGDFRFSFDERGISGLANPHDPFGATLMPSGAGSGGRGQGAASGRGGGAATLGLSLSYRLPDGDWKNIATRGPKWSVSLESGTVTYTSGGDRRSA